MKRSRFGRTHHRLSELCLSTSNFARYASQEESFAILDAFREAGGNCVQTSGICPGGNCVQTSGICPGVNLGDGLLGMPEELLGRWLKQRRVPRDGMVIATRIALTRPVIGGLQAYTELIRQCAEDSIRRIGCGHLDLLVVEWTDAVVPVAETIAALEAVVLSGEIRQVVPANFPPWRVIEALGSSRSQPLALAGLQTDYSLAVRTAFEAGAVKLCADHGLGVIARSPLAGGHLASRRLTTSFGALRARGPTDRHAAVAAEGIWPALAGTSRARRCSPAQVALAWVLAHPQITSVLVSVSSVKQLRELVAATRLGLTSDDLDRLGGRLTRPASSALAS